MPLSDHAEERKYAIIAMCPESRVAIDLDPSDDLGPPRR